MKRKYNQLIDRKIIIGKFIDLIFNGENYIIYVDDVIFSELLTEDKEEALKIFNRVVEKYYNAFGFKDKLYLFIEELYINDLITDEERENIDNYIKHNI